MIFDDDARQEPVPGGGTFEESRDRAGRETGFRERDEENRPVTAETHDEGTDVANQPTEQDASPGYVPTDGSG